VATKKTNSGPVGNAAQGADPKKTVPAALPESEWAFHKVRKSEIPYCARWELARLRGSKQKPWLELSEDAKAEFISADKWGLLEAPANLDFVGDATDSALKVITFLVDFRESEAKLVEGFQRWLRSSPHRKRWRKNLKPPKERWRSQLATIVVFRVTEAGFTRKTAQAKTSDLWKVWQLKQMTAPHWSRALRKAKALREKKPSVSCASVDKGYLFQWLLATSAKLRAK